MNLFLEEKEKNFERSCEKTCKVIWNFILDYQIYRPNLRDITIFIFLKFLEDEGPEEGEETRPLGFTSSWLRKVPESLEDYGKW